MMSASPDAGKPKDHSTSQETAPESPTTVRPFDMDDDDVPETGGLNNSATATPSATAAPSIPSDEAPPTQPPRPLTTQQKNEQILKEAFPSIDVTVIKAVLAASGGQIDPAFNALLGMSDPDAVQNEPPREAAPPPKPPRPANRTALTQMEADELYARQLAEHYDNVGAYEARTMNRGPGGQPRRQATGLKPNEMYDREHNFIDDDLPVITENIRKGFLETQTKVNSWFTNLKKKIDGEYDSDEDETQPSKHHPHGGSGRRSGEGSRQSTDYHRYDADPQVLSDDFAGMRLNPDGTPSGQSSSNPNLNKPLPNATKPDGRKVAFRDTVEDIGLYDASPKLPPKEGTTSPPASKQSKWQPLSTVEPSPIVENDPFSLGDSEDEKESKGGSREIKLEDSERVKAATADAMQDTLLSPSAKGTDGKKE
ncbi:hypothetical protein F5B22DRAFT_600308 [Xylaria bambusicola]|uniref:uncharacterized protein n=1 Tax=Xylaria bambusicola TaxID=326684 RepID=UPI002007C00E|nr:uncharacterized protein F5B22DRAFT_600308 [Xylaria bambusicola]KAI0518208.1 hypothetical protein F5B22DRAFT_600308 [Xylaria bambusicola]